MTTTKELIGQAVDRLADDLEHLSRPIHGHPELAYQEVKAARLAVRLPGAQGFEVERGVAGVETAFRATFETGAARRSRSCASTTRSRRSATPAATT